MSEYTDPITVVARYVERYTKADEKLSDEAKQEIASLITRSLAKPAVRETVEGLLAASTAWDQLKEKRNKDGWHVSYKTKGGDQGDIEKIILEKDSKEVELTGDNPEFLAFKSVFEKRSNLANRLTTQVLRLADENATRPVISYAAGLLFSMTRDKTMTQELLEEIGKKAQDNKKTLLDAPLTRNDVAEPMSRPIAKILRDTFTAVEEVDRNPLPGIPGGRSVV